MTENSGKQRGRPFQRGVSGNPGGRPKIAGEVIELARQRGPEAFQKLCALMDSDNETVALRACEAVLDRAIGKPRQMVEMSGDPDIPLRVALIPPKAAPLKSDG